MLLTRKKTGKCKGWLAYNGHPTRDWISQDDQSGPSILNDNLKLTCAIDAYEMRYVMSMDIPKAYVQMDIPNQKKGKRIVMKIRVQPVDWLIEVDSLSY